jgi:hypothetical protein
MQFTVYINIGTASYYTNTWTTQITVIVKIVERTY